MNGRKPGAVLEHLRMLAGNVLDGRVPESTRAGHARMLAEHAQDLRESIEVVAGVLPGGEVLDLALTGHRSGDGELVRAAAERVQQRRMLAELRDSSVPITTPVIVLDPQDTGRQNTYPLIRQIAIDYGNPGPTKPVIPGVAAGVAVVNPTLPLTDDTQITIADVGGAAAWDLAAAYVNVAAQIMDFADPAGAKMIDAALFDAVDQAAEEDVVSSIEAAAGDTRVAATLADDLDAAEGVAGAAGHGAAWLLLANPVDWPVVRRALPAAWGDGPRPVPIVSSGATAGTVTFAGPGAFSLLVTRREVYKADEPKVFGVGVAVARQFKLIVRDADRIATVTGVGA